MLHLLAVGWQRQSVSEVEPGRQTAQVLNKLRIPLRIILHKIAMSIFMLLEWRGTAFKIKIFIESFTIYKMR